MSVNTKLVAVPEADTRWRAYPRKGKLGLSGLPLSQERVKEENADRIWRRALFGNKPDGTQGRGLLPVLYDAGSATAQTFLLKQQAQNPDLATATSVGGVSMSTWSGIDKVSSGSGLVNVGPILLDLPKVVSTQDYTHLR